MSDGAGHERLLGAALAAGSLLLFLLLLELGLRALGWPPMLVASTRMVDAHWTMLLDGYPTNPRGYFDIDLRLRASRALFRRLAPTRYDKVASLTPWAIESRYNSLGLREVPPDPKPTGVRRVAVVGDSFSEGQGVKASDTLSQVLERLLNSEQPGRWQVRNCAQRGKDFPGLLSTFETALAYDPDLIVYALVLNDAERPPAFESRQAYLNDWIQDRERTIEQPEPNPWRSRIFDFAWGRIATWRVGRATTRWYLEMWDPEANPEGMRRTRQDLREMERRQRQRGARLLVAIWPLFVGLERDYPFARVHQTVARLCLELGIPCHDLLPAFQGRATAPLWVHPVDHHPNQVGHLIAATSLAPVVRHLAEAP
jgi:lysophospholipase L1-like esterase